MDPKVLLLDEPTAGLGATSRRKIGQMIARLREIGKAGLLVESDVDLVSEVADTVTVLDGGRVMLQGPVRTVFAENNWDRLSEIHLHPPRAAQLARRIGVNALTCDELVSKLAPKRKAA